jgi:hypothetical protein
VGYKCVPLYIMIWLSSASQTARACGTHQAKFTLVSPYVPLPGPLRALAYLQRKFSPLIIIHISASGIQLQQPNACLSYRDTVSRVPSPRG